MTSVSDKQVGRQPRRVSARARSAVSRRVSPGTGGPYRVGTGRPVARSAAATISRTVAGIAPMLYVPLSDVERSREGSGHVLDVDVVADHGAVAVDLQSGGSAGGYLQCSGDNAGGVEVGTARSGARHVEEAERDR